MAVKSFLIEGVGEVTVYKRRGLKNMRLSLTRDGKVRVSIPTWVPFKSGVEFAQNQREWIDKHKPIRPKQLQNGMQVGKSYYLLLTPRPIHTARTSIKKGEVCVDYPQHLQENHPDVQAAAQKAIYRALKKDAEALLIPRLEELSTELDLPFASANVRHLKSRWGSCSNKKDITLSFFLIQMPWELIDYVLIHELAHTKVFGHGPEFWAVVNEHLPHAKELKKQIRVHQPVITNVMA